MKRWTVLCLLLMLFASASAEAPGNFFIRSAEETAGAPAAEALSMTPAALWPEGALQLTCAASLYESADGGHAGWPVVSRDDAQITLSIPQDALPGMREQLMPVAISPNGETVLFRHDKAGLFALRGSQLIHLAATAERGVPDLYGKFANYMAYLPARFPYQEGTVWSPDGRYAVMTANQLGIINVKFQDLIIMDTARGEIFLAATTPRKFTEPGASTVLCAQFDRSGRFLYYVLYGSQYAHRYSLMRYDMETGENELCLNTEALMSLPGLYEMPDGRWLSLRDPMNTGDPRGLNVMSEHNGLWFHWSLNLSLPLDWAASSISVIPKRLYYAPHTGTALMRVSFLPQQSADCLVRIRTDDFSGMDAYWYLPSLDSTQMRTLVQTDMAPDAQWRWAVLQNVQLSPDGHHALLYASHMGESRYLLLRLEDMTLTPVCAPPEICHDGVGYGRNPAYLPGMVWNEQGTLLILDESGFVQAYTLNGF